MPASPLSHAKTRSIIGSSNTHFWYINSILFFFYHMHKFLNALSFGNHLGFSKAQKPQTYKAIVASLESDPRIKAIQS